MAVCYTDRVSGRVCPCQQWSVGMAKRKNVTVRPTPVKTDVRICFGIRWFATEAEAMVEAKAVQAEGATYNGGYFHGMACGRETRFDYVDKVHGPLFAVTF